jgi:hypothetical protein
MVCAQCGNISFSFNSTLIILWFLLSGWLAAQSSKKKNTFNFHKNRVIALLTAVCFVIIAFALFVGIFLTTGRYTAEIAYAHAIRADRSKADSKMIVAELDRATTLNQYQDDYVRNLSQALLLRVQDQLRSVTPNAPLSDVSKKYVQALVAASVNAAAKATTLSSQNAVNWIVRAEVYRSLTGLVDQSSKFAIDSYKRAIDLEPLNPNYWTELGKTELMIADQAQPLTLSKDPKLPNKQNKIGKQP